MKYETTETEHFTCENPFKISKNNSAYLKALRTAAATPRISVIKASAGGLGA